MSNAPPSSTMTRDFCVGFVHSNEQASNWHSWARSDSDNGRNETAGFFFPATTSICVVALELPRLVAPDVPNHFTHLKEMLLLPDSNYITWAPSIPCCLLSRPPVSRLCNLHTLPSETNELHNFPSQSPSALTGVPTTLAFSNGVSEAWSVCALLQATCLSSTGHSGCPLKRLFKVLSFDGWEAQNFALFSPLPPRISFFFPLSGGLLVELWLRFLAVACPKCAFGFLWGHFGEAMALNRGHNSTRRPPERGKKNENRGGRGEKRATFWAVRRRRVQRRGPARHPIPGTRLSCSLSKCSCLFWAPFDEQCTCFKERYKTTDFCTFHVDTH